MIRTCALFCCLSACFVNVVFGYQLPKPTGAYQVGTSRYHLIDLERSEKYVDGNTPNNRELMVYTWNPTEKRNSETTLMFEKAVADQLKKIIFVHLMIKMILILNIYIRSKQIHKKIQRKYMVNFLLLYSPIPGVE